MSNGAGGPDVIEDKWPRFFAHWSASTLGFFLRSLPPGAYSMDQPESAALLFAAVVSIVGGGINSNLPAKPRELLKSVGLGFALDVATLLAKITPLPP